MKTFSHTFLASLLVACGGSNPPAPSSPATAAPAASVVPESSASSEKEKAPVAEASKPKIKSKYTVDGVSVSDIDTDAMGKKLTALGYQIDVPGKTGMTTAGKWETFNFGINKAGKKNAIVVIVRPAKEADKSADATVEKNESPKAKFEQYKAAGTAVMDDEAEVMIALGVYRPCVANPKTCGKLGLIEPDAALSKKVFDAIFAAK